MISVVVINYNGRDYLDACLASVFAESAVTDNGAEVLLVDSGSTDSSAVEAARNHPVRLIELGENLGPAAARNRGLEEATRELVLLIDSDVELRPGCVAKLVQHVQSNPEVVIVQARSLLSLTKGVRPDALTKATRKTEASGRPSEEALGDADTERVHYDGGLFHFLGLVSLRNWYRPLAQAEGEGLVETDCAISLCCLGRRDALLAAGGFDEAMFILFEDLALSYALKMAGHRVGVAEDALCLHKGGTRGLSVRHPSRTYAARRSFLHARNRWLFVLTHYQLRSLLLLLPAFGLYGVVHVGFVITSGHLLAWLRGKWALLGLLGHIRSRRRLLQRLRKRKDRELLGCPPLSFNPGLTAGRLRGFVEGALSGLLRVYYAGVRWAL